MILYGPCIVLQYIYAVQQDKQSVLMSEFYSSPVLARQVSVLTGPSSGAFLQAIFADLVRGNTRTTGHVQPLFPNGWTCRVVRVYLVGLHI